MNEHQSSFPIHQAFAFAVQGIRLRLGRMLLVLAGITVAFAFASVLLVTNGSALLGTRGLFHGVPEDLAKQGQGLTRAPVFQTLWVGVALLICTAGTLNAIVMSVTERIKEIGTLKCLGSRNIHVVEIFLFESVLLGLLGGLLGSLLGYAFAVVSFVTTVGSQYLTGASAWAAAGNMVWCLGISVLLSLLASIVPVLMAAKVEPAAAMRYEV